MLNLNPFTEITKWTYFSFERDLYNDFIYHWAFKFTSIIYSPETDYTITIRGVWEGEDYAKKVLQDVKTVWENGEGEILFQNKIYSQDLKGGVFLLFRKEKQTLLSGSDIQLVGNFDADLSYSSPNCQDFFISCGVGLVIESLPDIIKVMDRVLDV